MDIFNGRYYNICKNLLLFLGLWPYDKRYKRILKNITFTSINISLAIPQAILLINKWGNDFLVTLENFISLLFATACIVKYTVTYVYAKQLEYLLTQVEKDWIRIKNEKERNILVKYGEEGRTLVIFYTVYIFFAWACYTSMPLIPLALDLIIPLKNRTRPKFVPFYGDYIYFDQLDYHYWCCVHITVVYFTSFFLYSGVDGIYVLTVKHTCGLFGITCHRISNITNIKKKTSSLELSEDHKVPDKLRKAITLHNDTIRCFNLLEDSFNICFLIVFFLCVVVISLIAVYLMFNLKDVYRSSRTIAFFIGIILHLFYINWIGQQIIDSSKQVFDVSYNSNWYLISVNARKFINIIMIRTLTPCALTSGKLTELSMNSFGVLIKSAVSYFTVFMSVTQ